MPKIRKAITAGVVAGVAAAVAVLTKAGGGHLDAPTIGQALGAAVAAGVAAGWATWRVPNAPAQ